MKFIRFKKIAFLLIFIISFGIIGCNIYSKPKEKISESYVDLTKLLEYKNSKIGDNSAMLNIIYNLPGNIYNQGLELKTSKKPYEIIIKYIHFKDISIKFKNDTSIVSPFKNVIKNNAMIIFSLVNNVDIINFRIDDTINLRYTKKELSDEYGDDLKNITKDKISLENFIKNNR